jgi:hypothetical protein
MASNCQSCKVQRTLLVRRLGIYAVTGLVVWFGWKKVAK